MNNPLDYDTTVTINFINYKTYKTVELLMNFFLESRGKVVKIGDYYPIRYRSVTTKFFNNNEKDVYLVLGEAVITKTEPVEATLTNQHVLVNPANLRVDKGFELVDLNKTPNFDDLFTEEVVTLGREE